MELKSGDKKMIGALVVVAAGAGIYLGLMPMYEEHVKREEEIVKRVQELRTAHKKAENMNELVSAVDTLKYRLAELQLILPKEAGSFELIEKMQALAAQTGVKISQIQPQDSRERGEGWKADSLNIQFTCYWYQFVQFVWSLENYERLIDITNISISPEALQPGAKLQNFTVSMTANVYSSTLTEN